LLITKNISPSLEAAQDPNLPKILSIFLLILNDLYGHTSVFYCQNFKGIEAVDFFDDCL